MKFALIIALLSLSPMKRGPVPHIISQKTYMVSNKYASPEWERHIFVRNPLKRPVWFWIECESHLTTVAIGQAGHRTSEYVFPGIPPEEQCLINHWEIQKHGISPKEWLP